MAVTLSSCSGSPASPKEDTSSKDITANTTTTTTSSAKPATKSKPRKRVNTAEKRHQHNAIERQRRETLNGKFITLARLLPALATSRRPSKSATVNGSISHLTYQRNQRLLASKLLRNLAAQHDILLTEVNEWRKASGFAPKDISPAWTEEMEEVCNVEKEVFGTFQDCQGGEDQDQDNDEDDGNNDAASFDHSMSASWATALITPRSSTEIEGGLASLNTVNNVHNNNNILFNQISNIPQRTTATSAFQGMNWSQEFAFGAATSMGSSTSSSLPFNAFMSDSMDQVSTTTGSPSNSIQGNVLTPPTTTADMGLYTPSPRSSATGNIDDKVHLTQGLQQQQQQHHTWTDQQMLFLQAVNPPAPVRQHSLSSLHEVTSNQQAQQHPQQQFNPSVHAHNLFNTLFNHQPNNQNNNQTVSTQAILGASPTSVNGGGGNSDAFTQSLLAQMFPSQGVTNEQVEQWRKVALQGLQTPSESMPNSRPGAGIRMNSMWDTVEGF